MPGWDYLLHVAQTRVLRLYGATLAEFAAPMPPGVLAVYIAHESAGVRWVTTSYPEAGLCQLTLREGDDETRRYNVDPFDPRANIWAAQQAFWQGLELARRLGMLESAREEAIAAWWYRSVGISSLRRLLRGERTVEAAVAWLEAQTAPATGWGQQSLELVRRRVQRAVDLVDLVDRITLAGGLPEEPLKPPAPRPPGLPSRPRDLASRLSWYARQARQAGDAATGPWTR